MLATDNTVITNDNTACALNNLAQDNTNDVFAGEQSKNKLESPDFSLIQGNSVSCFTIPLVVSPNVLGSLIGEDGLSRGNEVIEYTVAKGDTPKGIAEQFDISLNTLLWANDLSSNSKVKEGQTLVILPISGVLHYVKSGDTISAIAKKYKADANEIIIFNELSDGSEITIGDILVIPGGTLPASAPKAIYVETTPLVSNYFICPVAAPCRKTQGLHWYNAVDFSHGQCGESIYAAAGGEIIKVTYGWNAGAGNTVKILHPNGVATSYGHLQTILVKLGQQVSQGQIIGLMGGKPGMSGAGSSTGCHVHFAVYGAQNPFR